jgi:hypothetical protein
MGQGYTRNDTTNNIANGNVISAADLDGEFDAIVASFNETTGHTHDGTAAEGGAVSVIGPVQEYLGDGTAFYPKTTAVYTLGKASNVWANLHLVTLTLSGTATMATVDINGGAIDGTTIGATTPTTGTFSNLQSAANLTLGQSTPWTFPANWRGVNIASRHGLQATQAASSIALSSNAAIGASGWEYTTTGDTVGAYTISGNVHTWTAAVAGTDGGAVTLNSVMSINSSGTLVSSSVDIGGGNIDGTVIGAASPAAGTFTDLNATIGMGINGTTPVYFLNETDTTTYARTLMAAGLLRIEAGASGAGASGAGNIAIQGYGGVQYNNLLLKGNTDVQGTFGVTGLSTLPTVNIDGGNIDGTTIGGTTPAAGTFNAATVTSTSPNLVLIESDTTTNSRLFLQGGETYLQAGQSGSGTGAFGGNLSLTGYNNTDLNLLTIKGPIDINAGTIDGTIIGGTTPAAVTGTIIEATSTGTFPTLLTNGGSATNPTHTFTADTDTGMYRGASANTIGFTTGGVERVLITGAGLNGAIGGTTPAAGSFSTMLVAAGSASAPSMSFTSDTNTGIYSVSADIIGFAGAGSHTMKVNGSTYVAVSGNTSIGSVPAATGGTIYGASITTTGQYSANAFTDATAVDLNRNGTNGNSVAFRKSTVVVGAISVTGSATTYNTTSDYRTKENITPVQGPVELIRALNPITYTAIADGQWYDGFLAHEVQGIIPTAVTGELDGMKDEEYEVTPAVEATFDADGVELTPAEPAVMGTHTVPDMQSMDYSRLTPILTAALQEALNKIDTLTARIEALEALQ